MWGNNKVGQLGVQTAYDFTSIPTQICLDKSVVEVCCGQDHSLCITGLILFLMMMMIMMTNK